LAVRARRELKHLLAGLVQNWGSGGNSGWRERVVGWMEFLSEFGTKRTIINRAPNLKQ
jgi:hypothetical protein